MTTLYGARKWIQARATATSHRGKMGRLNPAIFGESLVHVGLVVRIPLVVDFVHASPPPAKV